MFQGRCFDYVRLYVCRGWQRLSDMIQRFRDTQYQILIWLLFCKHDYYSLGMFALGQEREGKREEGKEGEREREEEPKFIRIRNKQGNNYAHYKTGTKEIQNIIRMLLKPYTPVSQKNLK